MHAVRATAQCIDIKSTDQVRIVKFDMDYNWDQSVYRRLGYTRQMGQLKDLQCHVIVPRESLGFSWGYQLQD